MIRTNRSVFVVVCSLAAALFAAAVPGWSQAKEYPGLPNFGVVSPTLFRGAQPSTGGLANLKQMGVGIVLNFREESGETAKERSEVESLGMKYVGMPWSGRDYPSNSQIAQFLDLVRTNPQTKIFVHCQAGADRTGTMVAAYRIALEHKSVGDALQEMHAFHYHHFFLPQLERYVNSLPQLLKSEAVFEAYAPKFVPATVAASTMAGTIGAPSAISAVAQ